MINQTKKKSELEVLHPPSELSQRDSLARNLRKFSESVKKVDSDDFWSNLMQTINEIIGTESSSLLVFNEKTNELIVLATSGARADVIKS